MSKRKYIRVLVASPIQEEKKFCDLAGIHQRVICVRLSELMNLRKPGIFSQMYRIVATVNPTMLITWNEDKTIMQGFVFDGESKEKFLTKVRKDIERLI